MEVTKLPSFMRICGQPKKNLKGKALYPLVICSYRLFLEKSKNDWSERDRFVKRPGGLDLVEMEFDEKASVGKVNLNANASKSTLPMPIKEIISLFLDPKLLKDAFLEFDLDVQKMPLGKLSRNHILNAYGVLTDLEEVCSIILDNDLCLVNPGTSL